MHEKEKNAKMTDVAQTPNARREREVPDKYQQDCHGSQQIKVGQIRRCFDR